MRKTYLHAVASLDGYIADERDDVGPLHDWYFSGDHPLVEEDHADVQGAPFRVRSIVTWSMSPTDSAFPPTSCRSSSVGGSRTSGRSLTAT